MNMKRDLLEWAKFNRDLLAHHVAYATGTTGGIVASATAIESRDREPPSAAN